jgi:diamine N-acetyltransferase
MTDFTRLSAKTVLPLINLSVANHQKHQVAHNAVTMAQSIFEPGSEIYGLWHKSSAIGLIALIDLGHPHHILEPNESPDGLYVWRLMISEEHQGKGHGRAAMNFAERRCRALNRAFLLLSVVDDDNNAIEFYEKLGYCSTGNTVDEEIELRKALT